MTTINKQSYSIPKRSFWQRISDSIFGYDFFISYRWNDAHKYALELHQRLTENGLNVFIDNQDFSPGDNWISMGRLALKHTTSLVLIGSPDAVTDPSNRNPENDPIILEVKDFHKTKRRKVLIHEPKFDKKKWNTSSLSNYFGKAELSIPEKASFNGSPSHFVIQELLKVIGNKRKSKRRVRLLQLLTGVLSIALILSMFFWNRSELSKNQAKNALFSERKALKKEKVSRSNQFYKEAKIYREQGQPIETIILLLESLKLNSQSIDLRREILNELTKRRLISPLEMSEKIISALNFDDSFILFSDAGKIMKVENDSPNMNYLGGHDALEPYLDAPFITSEGKLRAVHPFGSVTDFEIKEVKDDEGGIVYKYGLEAFNFPFYKPLSQLMGQGSTFVKEIERGNSENEIYSLVFDLSKIGYKNQLVLIKGKSKYEIYEEIITQHRKLPSEYNIDSIQNAFLEYRVIDLPFEPESIKYASNGMLAISSGSEVHLYNTINHKLLDGYLTSNNIVNALEFSYDNKYIISGGYDRMVYISSVEDFKTKNGQIQPVSKIHLDSRINVLESVDSTQIVAIGLASGGIRFLDFNENQVVSTNFAVDGNIVDMVYSHKSNMLLVVSDKPSIHWFDMKDVFPISGFSFLNSLTDIERQPYSTVCENIDHSILTIVAKDNKKSTNSKVLFINIYTGLAIDSIEFNESPKAFDILKDSSGLNFYCSLPDSLNWPRHHLIHYQLGSKIGINKLLSNDSLKTEYVFSPDLINSENELIIGSDGPSGETPMIISFDGEIIESYKKLAGKHLEKDTMNINKKFTSRIKSYAVSEGGSNVCFGFANGKFLCFMDSTAYFDMTLEKKGSLGNNIVDIAFSRNKDNIVGVCNESGVCRVFDISKQNAISPLIFAAPNVKAMALNNNGTTLVTASYRSYIGRCELIWWDVITGRPYHKEIIQNCFDVFLFFTDNNRLLMVNQSDILIESNYNSEVEELIIDDAWWLTSDSLSSNIYLLESIVNNITGRKYNEDSGNIDFIASSSTELKSSINKLTQYNKVFTEKFGD